MEHGKILVYDYGVFVVHLTTETHPNLGFGWRLEFVPGVGESN